MNVNMSSYDRIIRAVIAAALVILAAVGVLTGTLAIVAYVLGAILLLTAVFGFCPIYRLLGIRTSKV